jgi:ubiquinone/menaquinone biosynthesis C-methylase UbiE
MHLIVYTTAYREGSHMFKRAAETLSMELSSQSNIEIICQGIRTKKDLIQIWNQISEQGKSIDQFHFIGHGGMYGPMYGTVEYPEQFSPFELKNLQIPFTYASKAYFHCCRSARWFAPFFAKQFNIETFGYHWYTSFSSNKTYFKRVTNPSQHVYAAACIGMKSHGILGSLHKYSGKQKLEEMISFMPSKESEDSSYNQVAELYNAVFQDIKVRKDEWNWLMKHLPDSRHSTLVDIGCGNGALLKALSNRIQTGIGLDASEKIIEQAEHMNLGNSNLSFNVINGPSLPLENQSVDSIVSMLSFRYLDWDPMMLEFKRVLKPGGKILIIDMVTVPVKWHELPKMLMDKVKQIFQRYTHKSYYKNLVQLVKHPAWKIMLKHNPIRSEHEMKWYLESRFPSQKVNKINIAWNTSILAFDSGPIEHIQDINLSYP